MGRRITIVLDEELEKKLRLIQSKFIKNSVKSISYINKNIISLANFFYFKLSLGYLYKHLEST